MDGWLDGSSDSNSGMLLIVTMPIEVGFARMEELISRIEEITKVDEWMYGNVYSEHDGKTPLNWWIEPDGGEALPI